MSRKKRDKKKAAKAAHEKSISRTPLAPAGGTRALAGLLLAALAVMVGGVLAVLESVKATLLQQ